MKRPLAFAFILACFLSGVEGPKAQAQETTNDFALWQELNISKDLGHDWSIDIGGDLRNRIDLLDRASIGVGVDKKVGKYLKFGLSYSFLAKHYAETTEAAYKDSDPTILKGYNIDADNWAQRHRLAFDITGDKRLWKTLRISLRERYQFTYQPSRDITRTRLRDANYDAEGNITGWDTEETVTKAKEARYRHLLRSRLKFAIDRKKWDWEPFASVEFHNDLRQSFHLDKLRAAIGTEYKVNRTLRINAAYVFTHENDEDGNQNIHALSVGCSIKL